MRRTGRVCNFLKASSLGILLTIGGMGVGLAANLLTNPGFELGQTGWANPNTLQGGNSVVITNAALAHSGANCVSNYNAGGNSGCEQGDTRGGWPSGVTLNISDQKFYKISAWVKVPGATTSNPNLTLRYRFEPSAQRVDVGAQVISTEDWTYLESGWLTPTPGDSYVSYWEVRANTTGTMFYADDCTLEESAGCGIAGVVKDNLGAVLAGVKVQLNYGGTVVATTTTDASGAYTFHVLPDTAPGTTYGVNATKIFYSSPADVNVATVALPGTATAANIVLTALPLVTLSGSVSDSLTSAKVADARISITAGTETLQIKSDASGNYSTSVAVNAALTVKATKLPLVSGVESITPTANTVLNLSMSSSILVGLYVTNLPDGNISTWTNKGSLGGTFGVLGAGKPVVGNQGQYRAASFDNSPMVLTNELGNILAPPGITSDGAQNYTVSAWLYDPDPTLPDQQSYISWAKRGGPDGSNCEMGYGVNTTWGAAGHWGAPDMPWGTPPTGGAWHHVVVTYDGVTEADYIDGVFSASETKSLIIAGSLPIVLGSGYDYNIETSVISPGIQLQASMAQVELMGAAAVQDDVTRLYTNGPPKLTTATIAGKVVTTDASLPSGFTIKVLNGSGAVVATSTTPTNGTYSIFVASAGNFTVTATKLGYVTLPGPQVAAATLGNTTTVPDFTATATTISGVVKDSITGNPIYNAVVQAGDPTGPAVVTEADGAFTLQGFGCGGAEVYADAVNYAGKRLLVTATGTVKKTIQLVAQAEPNSFNGDMENLVNPHPAPWVEAPWQTVGSIDWSASTTAKHGSKSLFYTTTATPEAYAGLYYAFPLAAGNTYNFYFRAKADPEVARWQPMVEFDNALPDTDPNYIWDGFVSADPVYNEYAHTPPYNWFTYLAWFDRNGTKNGPAVRWTPFAGVTQCMFKFLYEPTAANTGINPDGSPSNLPLAGKGCYIDDLVLDAVPNNLALETVPADVTQVVIPSGGFTMPGGVPTVTIPSVTGTNYRLVCKNALTDATWTVIGTTWTPGTGSNITLTDPTPNPAGRFYRVEVQ